MVILEGMHEEFFKHINNVDEYLEFTKEPITEQKTIPFLDTLVSVQEDSTLRLKVYRKPSHTDQYLPFDSAHPLEHKLSVVRTLYHRAETVVMQWDHMVEEKDVGEALKKCGYPDWELVDVLAWVAKRAREACGESTKGRKCQGRVTIPYVKGVLEEIRQIMGSASITTHFRPPGSLRQWLVHPKDVVPKGKKTNIVYRAVCGVCGDDYVGETQQPLVKWAHQHTHPAAGQSNLVVLDHVGDTGHRVDLDSFEILEREEDWRRQGIREAIWVRPLRPLLNKSGGLKHSSPLWNRPLGVNGPLHT